MKVHVEEHCQKIRTNLNVSLSIFHRDMKGRYINISIRDIESNTISTLATLYLENECAFGYNVSVIK